MINILILAKSVDGGTGTYVEGFLDLKNLYPDNYLNIDVVVLDKPKFRTINIGGYNFQNTNANRSIKYKLNSQFISTFIKELFWVSKWLKKFHPDIVIASDSHAILLSQISKVFFRYKYKTINIIHNNLTRVIDYKISKYLRPTVKNALSYFFNKSNFVVSVSVDLSKNLLSEFKLKKIPLSIPALLPNRSEKDFLKIKKNRKIKIISVGRFDDQKDHKTLINAFKKVTQKIKSAELWLIGDGPLRQNIENMVKRNNLSKKVVFFGWIQNPATILKKSSIFVLSSNWEGFPLVLLEAMNAGLPIIAANCDYGPSEIISNNKYGLLTQVGNARQMADLIIDLATNSKKRNHYVLMSKKRSKDYSKEKMLLMYKKIIDKLVK